MTSLRLHRTKERKGRRLISWFKDYSHDHQWFMMINTSLDWFGRFKNPSIQEEFVLHCLEQRSKYSFRAITIILLLWLIAQTIYSTWFSDTYSGNDQVVNEIYGIICLALIGIAVALSGIISMSLFNFQNRLIYSYLQAIYLVLITFVFILKGIQFLHIPPPQCIPEELKDALEQMLTLLVPSTNQMAAETLLQNAGLAPTCPSANSFSFLCSYTAVLIMLCIFEILTPILYEPRICLLVICDVSSGALILYTYYNSIYTLVPFLTTYLSIILVMIQVHFQRVQTFLHKRRLKQLLEENERNADANHAMEMRHMIGNVAHDLKTVRNPPKSNVLS